MDTSRRLAPVPAPSGADTVRIRHSEFARLFEDLAEGEAYQKGVLPQNPPPVPGYDLAHYFGAARGVSGDFFDYAELGDGRVGFLIADAAGKGVPAAMASMACIALFRNLPDRAAPPAKVLSALNRALGPCLRRGTFLTAVYAVLDPARHLLTVANAGHLPLLLWHSRMKIATVHSSKCPVLGFLPPWKFDGAAAEERLPLLPGDRFVLFTDGVNEAMAPGQQQFGMEHLRRRLKAESDNRSDNFVRSVLDQIEIHRAGGQASDDVTFVTGRRKDAERETP